MSSSSRGTDRTSSAAAPSVISPPPPSASTQPRTCFICLQTEAEDPSAIWVNACPCSLEAHEECMLTWIAEQESRGGVVGSSRTTLQCSACKAPIRVDEPYDAVVALRDRLHRGYSHVSPFILLCILTCGGVAGSGWYGLTMAQMFAGPAATFRWLGVNQLLFSRRTVPLWRWVPFWEVNTKIWMLSLIGPGIILSRALPGQVRTLCIPASLLYGAGLVGRDDMPSWPLSPEWAWTLMPYVHLTYSHLYWEFFGPLEKRLNRALRGLPPTADQPPAPQRDQEAGARAIQAAQGGQGGQRQDGDGAGGERGLWQSIWSLWRTLFHGDDGGNGAVVEGELALEIRLGVAGAGDGEAVEDEELVEIVREIAGEDAHGELPAIEPAAPQQHAPVAAAAEEQQQNQGQAQNEANAAVPAEENRTGGALTEIVNSLVSSLMLPVVSFGMGEVLRLTLPRDWVTRPVRRAPTALLQERWGRSLVGGCLFVVLKDAYVLYTKYRRVEVKRHRKVRNVERRTQPAST